MVKECPSSCSPAIKEEGVEYCISLFSNETCTPCSANCMEERCSGCLSCPSKSCDQKSNNIVCLCLSSPYGCECLSNEYSDETTKMCKSCYPECKTCNSDKKCLTCVDSNSDPDDSIGCVCKGRYYNTSALIYSGACLECYSDCSSCTETRKCTVCISENSSPHEIIGCVCNKYYFNTSSLNIVNACILCYDECQSCSNDLKCNECKSSNALPHSDKGCICKDGF